MHRHLHLLLVLLLTASSLSAGSSLTNCNRTFNCGLLVEVFYPFTGSDRPAHCGQPEFLLSCDGCYPELTADSLTYHVLALDQTRQSLTLLRTDLYNTIARLQQYANTTLNSTIFTFASDNDGLTLFYKCSNSTNINPDNLFSCEINATETDNYHLIGAVPTDPILNGSGCNVSVTVPILRSAVTLLTAYGSTLREALMGGFEVNYTNPYKDKCVMCGGIGGERGFDLIRGSPFVFVLTKFVPHSP